MNNDMNLKSSNLSDEEKKLALSVSKKMSIIDKVLLMLLCDDMKKKKFDVNHILSLLELIDLDEGEFHTLHKKCCQEDFQQIRIVLYAWARGEITTNGLKEKIKKKSDLHTMY